MVNGTSSLAGRQRARQATRVARRAARRQAQPFQFFRGRTGTVARTPSGAVAVGTGSGSAPVVVTRGGGETQAAFQARVAAVQQQVSVQQQRVVRERTLAAAEARGDVELQATLAPVSPIRPTLGRPDADSSRVLEVTPGFLQTPFGERVRQLATTRRAAEAGEKDEVPAEVELTQVIARERRRGAPTQSFIIGETIGELSPRQQRLADLAAQREETRQLKLAERQARRAEREAEERAEREAEELARAIAVVPELRRGRGGELKPVITSETILGQQLRAAEQFQTGLRLQAEEQGLVVDPGAILEPVITPRELRAATPRGRLESLASRLQVSRARAPGVGVPTALGIFGVGAALGVQQTVGGVLDLLRPGGVARAGRGLFELARAPRRATEALGLSLITSPALTAGRIFGTVATLRAEQLAITRAGRAAGASRARAARPEATGVKITSGRVIRTDPTGTTILERSAVRGTVVGRGLFGRQLRVNIVGAAREVLAPSPTVRGASVLRGSERIRGILSGRRGATFTAQKITEGISRTTGGQTSTTRFTSQFATQVGQPRGVATRAVETFVTTERPTRIFTTAEGARITLPRPQTIIATTGRIRFAGPSVSAKELQAITPEFIIREIFRPTPGIQLRVAGRAARISTQELLRTSERTVTLEKFRGGAFSVRPQRFRFATGRDVFGSKIVTDAELKALRLAERGPGRFRGPFVGPIQPQLVTIPSGPVTPTTPTIIPTGPAQTTIAKQVARAARAPAPSLGVSLQASAQEFGTFAIQQTIRSQAAFVTRAASRLGTATGIAALTGTVQRTAAATRLVQEVRQITIPRQAIVPRAAVIQRAALLTRTAVLPRTAIFPRIAVSPVQALITRQAVIPRAALRPRVGVTPQPPIVPPIIPLITTRQPPPFLGGGFFPADVTPTRRLLRPGAVQPLALTPGFVSLTLNIRGNLQALAGRRLTGFERRPIPRTLQPFTL